MDTLLLILLLWAAFLLMLWILRLGLDHVEASLEPDDERSPDFGRTRRVAPCFVEPDGETEIIGYYMGTPIHRSIINAGIEYRYDRVEPSVSPANIRPNERCLAPGIVYVAR